MNKAIIQVIDNLDRNLLDRVLSEFFEEKNLVIEFVEWVEKWKKNYRIRYCP